MNTDQDNAAERIRDTRAVLRTFTPAERTGAFNLGPTRHLPLGSSRDLKSRSSILRVWGDYCTISAVW